MLLALILTSVSLASALCSDIDCRCPQHPRKCRCPFLCLFAPPPATRLGDPHCFLPAGACGVPLDRTGLPPPHPVGRTPLPGGGVGGGARRQATPRRLRTVEGRKAWLGPHRTGLWAIRRDTHTARHLVGGRGGLGRSSRRGTGGTELGYVLESARKKIKVKNQMSTNGLPVHTGELMRRNTHKRAQTSTNSTSMHVHSQREGGSKK